MRFTTAAARVNQLVEAQRDHSLSRMLARWSRVELIVIDELGVPQGGPEQTAEVGQAQLPKSGCLSCRWLVEMTFGCGKRSA